MSRTKHHWDKAKQRRFGDSWNWLRTPGWWHRLMHHGPAKRKERDRLVEVMKGLEPTDWPDRKKPESYFW